MPEALFYWRKIMDKDTARFIWSLFAALSMEIRALSTDILPGERKRIRETANQIRTELLKTLEEK